MNAFNGLKEVFSKPYYILVALSGILLFYILNVIVSDFSDLKYIASGGYSKLIALKLVLDYFIGYPTTIGLSSTLIIFGIAVLFGSYISMAIYKTTQIKSSQTGSVFGTIGIFLGFIAPGCLACGIGIASILGLSGVLIALPFKGAEIFILSFIMLLYANFSIAKKVGQNTCNIVYRSKLKA